MADTEEPQFTTLAERIAALNKQKNFGSGPSVSVPSSSSSSSAPASRRTPSSSAIGHRPPPPPPTSSTSAASASKPAQPRIQAAASAVPAPRPGHGPGFPPPLPPRRSSSTLSSSYLSQQQQHAGADRRPSTESVRSHLSAMTVTTAATSSRSLSRMSSNSSLGAADAHAKRKLPPAYGSTKLPPLPPTRREVEAKAAAAARETVAAEATAQPSLPLRPGSQQAQPPLPPRLPPRSATAQVTQDAPAPALPARRPTAKKSALDMGFGDSKGPTLPTRPVARPFRQDNNSNGDDDDGADETPPPLPMASRPSRAQIEAVVKGSVRPKPMSRPTASRPTAGRSAAAGFYPPSNEDEVCLKCRDFSAPDAVAARFPLTSLPRTGVVAFLARQLCDPFPSQTDKARAIFTWCYHNIAYDVEAFFSGCFKHGETIEERIFSGKAVCEGYARTYEAVAKAAGLECVVVGGHGKGFGFAKVRRGVDRVPPPNPTGHAWNAVRIDGGEWKLLDACWGAGNVDKDRRPAFERRFNPKMFTMDNDTFGESHFPENSRYFFRSDGRALSWAEYIVENERGSPAMLYSNGPEQFIDADSVEPRGTEIRAASGPDDGNDIVHFRWGRACRHWTLEKDGRGLAPYFMFLRAVDPDNSGGGNINSFENSIEVKFDSPLWFYADVPRCRLGRPGQEVFCYALTTRNDRDMRGATVDDFKRAFGPGSMSYRGVCSWKLV